ncbi:MAG: UvrD-helicase domain-containing protein [Myxococcota bacterium]
MKLSDDEARARIREDLDHSFLVEAAAGTGKTAETVHRIVAAIAAGRVEASGLVALSFTRKAAGALALRLRRGLERAARAQSGPASTRLQDALVHLDEAHIGTIHGFCAELLRRHPVEAGIDPDFERLDEAQEARLQEEVFRIWFERRLADGEPRLKRALAHSQTYAFNDIGPWERLTKAARDLIAERHFDGAWPRLGLDWESFNRAFAPRVAALGQALSLRAPGLAADFAKRKLDPLVEFGDRMRLQHAEAWAPEELEAALVRVMKYQPPRRSGRIGERGAAELAKEAQALKAEWAAHRREADADLAAELRDLLWEVVEAYEARKQRLGKLDYLDLLLRTRSLLQDEDLRARVRKSVQLVFVDEFQDTDPLQTAIVEQVANVEGGGLFIVGDPKQSIYGFRSADMGFYLSFAESLRAKGVERLELTHSFRALEPIQDFINAAFEEHFEKDPAQPAYVPLRGGPEPSPGMPPPLCAFTTGRQEVAAIKWDQARRLSGMTTGRLIEWILRDSGWQVRSPSGPDRGTLVPVRPEHIGVLLRSMPEKASPEAWVRSLMQELERRHLPFLVHGRRYLDDRSEVAGLVACLNAIEWPNDSYWVYAALRSPLFHLPDDLLAEWAAVVGPLHPGTSAPEGEERLAPVAEALALFDELARKRNERSLSTTLQLLLRATRAVAGFAHEHAGPEAVAGVRGIVSLAEQHEREQQSAFRTFVERLDGLGSKALAEQQLEAEGVRILNIHQVKGLEFPIVILGDPYDAQRNEPSRHVEASSAYFRLLDFEPAPFRDRPPVEGPGEELRIAYVAATRARDCLIVTSKPGEPWDRKPAWFAPLEKAVRPASGWDNSTPSMHWPHGQPCCVISRTSERDDPLPLSGRHGVSGGEVDWIPSSLFDRAPASHPIMRRIDALRDGAGAAASVEAHRKWRDERAALISTKSEASVVLLRPSDTEDEPKPGLARRVRTVRVEQEKGRPRGRRFGHLVHEVLRHAFDAPLEDALQAAARQVDATHAEQAAAKRAVELALSEPLLLEARRSMERQTELPVCRMSDEGLLLDGVVDLWFRDDDGRGVVLDYKTHEELDEAEAKRQIAWYLWALEPAQGQGLRGVVFVL